MLTDSPAQQVDRQSRRKWLGPLIFIAIGLASLVLMFVTMRQVQLYEQLREIDRRIRYLQKRIPDLQVVDALPGDREKVFFGATVILGDETGEECSYRIVGADETDAKTGWISVDSPMSKAVLGKRLDEEVTVRTPTGSKMYWILAIDYEAFHD